MWAALESPDEILKWDLPEGIPAGLLYDHILKRQKSETVKIKEPKGRKCVEEFISAASSAKKFFTAEKPALFIASHAVGVSSAWVWIALQHGVRVIVPFGYDGLCRFWSLSQVTDIFDFGHLLNLIPSKVYPKSSKNILNVRVKSACQCGLKDWPKILAPYMPMTKKLKNQQRK